MFKAVKVQTGSVKANIFVTLKRMFLLSNLQEDAIIPTAFKKGIFLFLKAGNNTMTRKDVLS